MISSVEALRVIERHRKDAVVVATMSPLREWQTISQRRELDLDLVGCMSKASSLALGVALARPHVKVIVLDGDGSLLMNLGSLVTIANMSPGNLLHFVFQDGEYTLTGGQPIPGVDKLNFVQMAKAAGYRNAYEFDTLHDLASRIGVVIEEAGPTFVCLKVVHDHAIDPLPSRETRDAMRAVAASLRSSQS